ncbi:MAG: glycosyltransferase family 1 protein, partial [Thermoproteus sp.]
LTPVVHKSGGAWTDLAEEGRYGLGYQTAEEAVEALAKTLTQPLGLDPREKVASLTLDNYAQALWRYVR